MRNREVYKKKIYTELEIVQARFAEFKAQGQNFDTATRARHNRHSLSVTMGVGSVLNNMLRRRITD